MTRGVDSRGEVASWPSSSQKAGFGGPAGKLPGVASTSLPLSSLLSPPPRILEGHHAVPGCRVPGIKWEQ